MEASADLALVLLGILIVGGLSLLAHESRKNRVAEILLLFAIVVPLSWWWRSGHL